MPRRSESWLGPAVQRPGDRRGERKRERADDAVEDVVIAGSDDDDEDERGVRHRRPGDGERGASHRDAAAMKTAKPKCWLAIAAVEL